MANGEGWPSTSGCGFTRSRTFGQAAGLAERTAATSAAVIGLAASNGITLTPGCEAARAHAWLAMAAMMAGFTSLASSDSGNAWTSWDGVTLDRLTPSGIWAG